MRQCTICMPLLFLIAVLPYVAGYCIYNNHTDDTYIWIRQIKGAGSTFERRFKRERLHRNEKACCPYTVSDCQVNRDRDALVVFAMRQKFPQADGEFFEINVPAGGSIVFAGNYYNPTIHAYDPSGEPFKFEFLYNPNDRKYQ
ncbi:uncharacterized protein BYT42DRAFT_153875 [Radiomyces spectabilis]|uniref:uncharacterized protein n=1 Tax=Radiomyces spectabilis TaxID=64574 RepID=UPI002220B9BF|nr:uncharacterized protein BYT42DRAFT_153875 [Radiomyces spectabilis]KAI8366098.1 hypothetical protein BYT42DRAFT_153875 [Radiomyces spectabilis]